MNVDTEAVAAAVLAYGLTLTFLLMASNGTISFPPSEVVLLAVGFAASSSFFTVGEAIFVATAGNVLGALILYAVGRTIGPARISGFVAKVPNLPFLRHFRGRASFTSDFARELFYRHDVLLLLLLRCAPVVRSIVSLPAGAYGVRVRRFLLLTIIGCTLWCAIWIWIGSVAFLLYTSSRVAPLAVLLIGVSVAMYLVRSAVNRTLLRLVSRDDA